MPQGVGYGPYMPQAPLEDEDQAMGALGLQKPRMPLPPMPNQAMPAPQPGMAMPGAPGAGPGMGVAPPTAGMFDSQGPHGVAQPEDGMVPGMSDEDVARMMVEKMLSGGGPKGPAGAGGAR